MEPAPKLFLILTQGDSQKIQLHLIRFRNEDEDLFELLLLLTAFPLLPSLSLYQSEHVVKSGCLQQTLAEPLVQEEAFEDTGVSFEDLFQIFDIFATRFG